MNISKEEFNNYLQRRLSSDQMMKIDTYLEQHPLERKALDGAVEFEENDSFDELISEIDYLIDIPQKQQTTQTSSTSNDTPIISISDVTRWIAAIAAVLLLFIFVRGQWGTGAKDLSHYFDAYPDVITNIVRGEESKLDNTSIARAMEYYNEGAFESALPILNELQDEHPNNQNITFYCAIAEFALGEYQASLSKFDVLSSNNTRFPYDDGAIWYKALCLIHLDQIESAKSLLTKISLESHYKKDEAIELLESL